MRIEVIRCIRRVTFVLVNMAAIATDDGRGRAGLRRTSRSSHLDTCPVQKLLAKSYRLRPYLDHRGATVAHPHGKEH